MAPMPPIAASEMPAARSAYSIRSCPSSSRTNRTNRAFIFFSFRRLWAENHEPTAATNEPGLAGAADRRADLVVLAVQSAADCRDATQCRQRDTSRQKRVLDEVLPLILTNEPSQESLHF